MAQISRNFTFSDNTVAYGSQVESEFQNLVNSWNSHDLGVTGWTAIKSNGDITIAAGYGIIITTPDSSHTYRLGVDNNGNPTVIQIS